MKKLILSVFAIVALSSQIVLASGSNPYLAERVTVTKVDTIYNFMPVVPPGGHKAYSIVEIDVTSTGCTEAEDFKLRFRDEMQQTKLYVQRIRPDLCEVTPHTVNLRFRVDRGLDRLPLTVVNPLLVEKQKVY